MHEEKQEQEVQKASGERLLYTIFYAVIAKIVSMIICLLVVAQFLYSWIAGNPNEKLLSFSASLSEYVKQLIVYISFNSDAKPWPMGDWPAEEK